MSTNSKPNRAGLPWTLNEIKMVGMIAPRWDCICEMAEVLERTPHAVQYMLCKLYTSTTDLKEWAKVDTSKSQQAKNILQARRDLNIGISISKPKK